MIRKRSLGRILAMKYLFSRDAAQDWVIDDFEAFAADQEPLAEARDFARSLVTGIIEHRSRLMSLIESSTRNWTWKRMPLVDRNLLLIGSHEILNMPDIPATVTINEIVELAKTYSTALSGAFVNGVLDTIAKNRSQAGEKES